MAAHPGPRLRVAVQVVLGNAGHMGYVAVISQQLARKGFESENAPAPLNGVEQGRSQWNEIVLGPWISEALPIVKILLAKSLE